MNLNIEVIEKEKHSVVGKINCRPRSFPFVAAVFRKLHFADHQSHFMHELASFEGSLFFLLRRRSERVMGQAEESLFVRPFFASII